MRPASHVVVGLATGTIAGFAANSSPAEFALITSTVIAGSVAPDIPIVAQVLFDKMAGRRPFSAEFDSSVSFETTSWFLFKEISHSLIIWTAGFFAGALLYPALFGLLLLAFSSGVLLHWIVDIFTHCGVAFRDTDQSFLWPFYGRRRPGRIPKLGQAVGRTGLGWEYRYNYKDPDESGHAGEIKESELFFQLSGLVFSSLIVMLYLVSA